jgi:hypothetical protein
MLGDCMIRQLTTIGWTETASGIEKSLHLQLQTKTS